MKMIITVKGKKILLRTESDSGLRWISRAESDSASMPFHIYKDFLYTLLQSG